MTEILVSAPAGDSLLFELFSLGGNLTVHHIGYVTLAVVWMSVAMNIELPKLRGSELTVIKLWEGVAPGSENFVGEELHEERGTPQLSDLWIGNVSQPSLTLVDAKTTSPTAAMVICPGGGYGGLAFEKEGTEVAHWLAERGVTCFVLKYRHGGGAHQHPMPLADAQRAMRIVRSLAKEKGYALDRIGVMGFSAGGHLASSVGTHFDSGNKSASDTIEQQSCRPDFMVLIYPVISMDERITHAGSLKNLLGDSPDPKLVELMSNDVQVTSETPPTFIAHASDDGAVPVENALRFYRALVEHKVPAELHVFAEGGHGFGMRRKDIPVEQWPTLLASWLKSRSLAE